MARKKWWLQYLPQMKTSRKILRRWSVQKLKSEEDTLTSFRRGLISLSWVTLWWNGHGYPTFQDLLVRLVEGSERRHNWFSFDNSEFSFRPFHICWRFTETYGNTQQNIVANLTNLCNHRFGFLRWQFEWRCILLALDSDFSRGRGGRRGKS